MTNNTQQNGSRQQLAISERHCGIDGVSRPKTEVFNWTKLDEPGEFMWIPKTDLLIDPEYQRKQVSEQKVLAIARDWSWRHCSTLSVGYRSDGLYFVFDGQHRKIGADKRADIHSLPCMVYKIASLDAEASAFIGINLKRNNVGAVDRFRAMVVAGDRSALGVMSLLKNYGLSYAKTGSLKTVACVGTLLQMAQKDHKKLASMFPLFVSMHQNCEIYGDVIRGVWSAESALEDKKQTVLRDPYYSKLIRIGGQACLAEIRRLSIQRNKGGEAVHRDAILSVLRKKI
jgi:hypothetical protein